MAIKGFNINGTVQKYDADSLANNDVTYLSSDDGDYVLTSDIFLEGTKIKSATVGKITTIYCSFNLAINLARWSNTVAATVPAETRAILGDGYWEAPAVNYFTGQSVKVALKIDDDDTKFEIACGNVTAGAQDQLRATFTIIGGMV